MGLFDHFPYTNVHELNLDWVLSMMKALEAEWEAFIAGNSLQFADPMLHDVTKTYAKNTIVLDDTGNAYVSLQAVPVGVGLQNEDYWLMVFDYEAFIEKVNKNFTARYYRGSYRATSAMAIGDWLTVDDILYKATAAIAVDDILEDEVNITHFTLEDFIKAFMQSATQLINQYKYDIDASELLYRQQLAQDIANTTASLQAQLDLAISGATVDSEVINARLGADGVTYPTLGDAIRTQFTNSDKSKEVINSLAVENKHAVVYPDPMTTDALDIADNSGNIAVAIDFEGTLKAPDFSSKIAALSKTLYSNKPWNFAIADSDNNIVFGILNGKAIDNLNLYGKKLSIVGDSISTYSGYIPTGYLTYYPRNDVDSVEKTWWYKLADELSLEIIANASWSGSTVTGNSQGDGSCACSDTRIDDLKGSNNETPDIIIIYMTTNDWVSNAAIGNFNSHDVIPAEGVQTKITEAYALMLYKIRTEYPNAMVYCLTNLEGRLHPGDTTYPIENNNNDTIHEVNHAITEVAHIMGAHVIDLNTSGIHYWNVSSYTVDGKLHPNTAGHEIIKEVVKDALLNTYHNM